MPDHLFDFGYLGADGSKVVLCGPFRASQPILPFRLDPLRSHPGVCFCRQFPQVVISYKALDVFERRLERRSADYIIDYLFVANCNNGFLWSNNSLVSSHPYQILMLTKLRHAVICVNPALVRHRAL